MTLSKSVILTTLRFEACEGKNIYELFVFQAHSLSDHVSALVYLVKSETSLSCRYCLRVINLESTFVSSFFPDISLPKKHYFHL